MLADDDLFHRLTRYLDFEGAKKTSDHVERENREFRKRQKSHYRLRSLAHHRRTEADHQEEATLRGRVGKGGEGGRLIPT